MANKIKLLFLLMALLSCGGSDDGANSGPKTASVICLTTMDSTFCQHFTVLEANKAEFEKDCTDNNMEIVSACPQESCAGSCLTNNDDGTSLRKNWYFPSNSTDNIRAICTAPNTVFSESCS